MNSTNAPIAAYNNFTEVRSACVLPVSVSPRMKTDPSNGPMIVPNALNVCEKLIRCSDLRSSPSAAENGWATVSNVASQQARMNKANLKKPNDSAPAAGIKRNAPMAYKQSPSKDPFL